MFKSEATTRNIRVRVQSSYVPERSAPDQNSWFFIYTVEIANQGERGGAAGQPPLDHHRRQRRGARGARTWRGRRAAHPRARRVLHLHLRLPARDAVRHHARHLSDGHQPAVSASTPRSPPSRSASRTRSTRAPTGLRNDWRRSRRGSPRRRDCRRHGGRRSVGAEHPGGGVVRQLGQALQELLDVVADELGAEVGAQEVVEVGRRRARSAGRSGAASG